MKDIIIKDFNMNELLPEIYKDIAQPIAKQAGVALGEVGKLVFSPIYYPTNYLNDRMEKWFARIKDNVPKENRIEAKPYITIPTLQNLALHNDETLLGEMFFNILQNSVDKTKQIFLSPAFPKILEQISSEEAKILTALKIQEHIKFSYYSWWDRTLNAIQDEICELDDRCVDKQFFLINWRHLERLYLVATSNFKQTENYLKINKKFITISSQQGRDIVSKGNIGDCENVLKHFCLLNFTDFGKSFVNICISDKCKEFLNDLAVK